MGTPQQAPSPSNDSLHSRPRSLEDPTTHQVDARTHVLDRLGMDAAWQDREVTYRTHFAVEIVDTIRYFVQHALVTIIFLLKLCALPLIFIVKGLAGSSDLPWLTTVAFPHPSREMHSIAANRPDTNKSFRQHLSNIIGMVTLPLRMARDLYHLSTLLQQHPNIFQVIRGRDHQASGAVELDYLRTGNRRLLPGVSAHNLPGPPAPSEVYHAALSERGDLDEILAAFDLEESGRENSVSNKNDQKRQDAAEYERLRSLQITPAEMHRSTKTPDNIVPAKIALLHPDGFACFDSIAQRDQESLAPPSTEKMAYAPKAWDGLARMDDQRHMSLPEECIGHDINELLGDTDDLGRCPTYVRRHRRLQHPRWLATQSALNLGARHDSKGTQPIRHNSQPRKGARLQKRRPVPTVANTTGMTSLLRRF